MRDGVIDFVVHWHKQTGICIGQILIRVIYKHILSALPNGTYGSLTSWLQDWEKRHYHLCQAHPDQGYRRLAYQMIDEDVVAVSPSSVYKNFKQGLKEGDRI